jgi:hypothetical protein
VPAWASPRGRPEAVRPALGRLDPIAEGRLLSRFTARAGNALAMARAIAGSDEVSADAIVVALLSEPERLAARILHSSARATMR